MTIEGVEVSLAGEAGGGTGTSLAEAGAGQAVLAADEGASRTIRSALALGVEVVGAGGQTLAVDQELVGQGTGQAVVGGVGASGAVAGTRQAGVLAEVEPRWTLGHTLAVEEDEAVNASFAGRARACAGGAGGLAGQADGAQGDRGARASLPAGTDEVQEPRGAGIADDRTLAGQAVGGAGLALGAGIEGASGTVQGAASVVGQVAGGASGAGRPGAGRAPIGAGDA